jgi:hypothetical protein
MFLLGAGATTLVAQEPRERSEARLVLLVEFVVLLLGAAATAFIWAWIEGGP